MKNKFLFTCGDINGIGPEISLKLFNQLLKKKTSDHYIFLCPLNVFEYYLKLLNLKFSYQVISEITETKSNILNILPMPDTHLKIGVPTKISGKTAYHSLIISLNLLKLKLADAVITAPVSKHSFELAGINFPGQTEILASECKTKNFLMMFLSKKMIAALATIHIPIKDVSKSLSVKLIRTKINILLGALENDLSIKRPQIAILGLNPHAGEQGRIGKEETKLISPSIKYFEKNVYGPFVPDAFFANHLYKKFDAVLGMYHDQVLIPFKMMNFNNGVNYTAGLPIIRTSPDHGTAFDIAGKGIADFSSLLSAFNYAKIISNNRKKIER
ncbi:4-hydroxythreonine-4-phosphate dehydrogenase [Ignavibacterium album JCM 16511]|uniref:4-hydroxythreonine-4-phosphate dehydrogenase n=1 Tax=Ignavibacterium album (strain DSM 19864 / JCM 16511 / NBRC 101810 / Mat9-16) TaxID=945713 RepID=I0AK14_IGNAJ|nr:4-hydroxythreonine-4-phosphate dehydrogenase PdxA [Ignavibacterium album]AFH49321.1 4-hydroxythreonine-4-phosphate dehydrogenase [Ignavibacterium album JCM 16511]